MRTSGNTVLITGGSNGIGLALAQRFLEADNTVIVCGRRESKLRETKEKYPQIHTRVCDVAEESQRRELFDWVAEEFSEVNILVNNAGIQQRVDVTNATLAWSEYQREVAINLDAPIHLSLLFIPHLAKQHDPAIINISSGLAVTPAAWAPIYSATKAALHSFSMSLRLQLKDSIEVLEVLPPAVNTDLGGVGLHTFGADVDEFADSVYEGIKRGDKEIGFGGTDERLHASKIEIDAATDRMWNGFLQNNPGFRK